MSNPRRPAAEPRIELLVVEDCPNAESTRVLLRDLLDSLGRPDLETITTVVRDDYDAALFDFFGSPTVRIDGVDPFADGTEEWGLACRVYRTPAGPRGTPDQLTLRSALLGAVDRR